MHSEKGQATIEAAVVLPLLIFLIIALIQPVVILYDHMVMSSAASEACRLLATKTASSAVSDVAYEEVIKRKLSSIPPIPLFHIHEGSCSWEIQTSGDEHSGEVSVRISNKVRLMPLIGDLANFLGISNNREYVIEVEQSAPALPAHIDFAQLMSNKW